VTYYVHSTVLGSVLSQVSATGSKERIFVIAVEGILAIQSVSGSTQSVSWEHYDASGGSYRPTNAAGTIGLGAERDPFGADAGVFKPITWPTPASPGKIEPYYAVPQLNSVMQGCEVDKVPMPCDMLQSLMEAGAIQRSYLLPVEAKEKPKRREPDSSPDSSPPETTLQFFLVDIFPRGAGVFSELAPTWVTDEEGGRLDWREISHHAAGPSACEGFAEELAGRLYIRWRRKDFIGMRGKL
jgi:hypothetical protein